MRVRLTHPTLSKTVHSVIIRNVQESDLDACDAIESSCYTTDAAPREKIEKRIRQYPEGFLVAVVNGCIVGMINSGAIDKDDITDEPFKDMIGHVREGKNIVVFSLAVFREFRGIGISRKLMHAFIEASKAMKKEKILLICKSELISYYRKYGFYYAGKSTSKLGGFEWHEMCLPLVTSQ